MKGISIEGQLRIKSDLILHSWLCSYNYFVVRGNQHFFHELGAQTSLELVTQLLTPEKLYVTCFLEWTICCLLCTLLSERPNLHLRWL